MVAGLVRCAQLVLKSSSRLLKTCNCPKGKVQRAAACYMQRNFHSLTQFLRFQISFANWGSILSSPPFNWA
jgi:hypothetical protein